MQNFTKSGHTDRERVEEEEPFSLNVVMQY